MKDLFSTLIEKLSDILYEVLGLLLPTLILCVVLMEPLFYMKDFSWKSIRINDDLELLKSDNLFVLILFIIAIFYVVGNVIKVLAKLYYDFGKAIFDDTLLMILDWIYSKVLYLILWLIGYKILHPILFPIYDKILHPIYDKILHPIYDMVYPKDEEEKQTEEKQNSGVEKHNSDVFQKLKTKPIFAIFFVPYKWIRNTLVFKTERYGRDFEELYTELAGKVSITLENEKDKEEKWFLFYKKATTLIKQNNINTLYYKFLAKYNSFRSIEFAFFCGIIYNIFFRHFDIDLQRYFIVLGVNVVCLISFHEKFKRYWKLCGNEAIAGMDYYYRYMEGKK